MLFAVSCYYSIFYASFPMIYMLRSPLHFALYTLHCTFHISTSGSSYNHNNLHGRTLTFYLSFLLIRPQIMNSRLLMSHAYSIFMNDIYCFIYISYLIRLPEVTDRGGCYHPHPTPNIIQHPTTRQGPRAGIKDQGLNSWTNDERP